jgi:hypothetical protein
MSEKSIRAIYYLLQLCLGLGMAVWGSIRGNVIIVVLGCTLALAVQADVQFNYLKEKIEKL